MKRLKTIYLTLIPDQRYMYNARKDTLFFWVKDRWVQTQIDQEMRTKIDAAKYARLNPSIN